MSTAPEPHASLLTRDRWIEIGRIAAVGIVIALYDWGVASLPVLLVAIAVGLYPLFKTDVLDFVREHKMAGAGDAITFDTPGTLTVGHPEVVGIDQCDGQTIRAGNAHT